MGSSRLLLCGKFSNGWVARAVAVRIGSNIAG
jgi:hypothetical protein